MTGTPAPARPTLIYDGDCAFCARCARFARRWVDRGERYEIRPWQSLDVAAFGLRPEDCDGAAQFVTADGSIRSGHRAIASAAAHGAPGWRPLGYLLLARRLPSGRSRLRLGRRPPARPARRHRRLRSGASGTLTEACGVGPDPPRAVGCWTIWRDALPSGTLVRLLDARC